MFITACVRACDPGRRAHRLVVAAVCTSVRTCRTKVFHKSTVQGVPKLRYDVSTISTNPGLPVKDNAVATITVAAQGSTRHLYGKLIFQREGAVLTGVYLESLTKPTSADLALAQAMAVVTGKRLIATMNG